MTNCFCIKGTYDFYIKVIDPYTIVYNDISQWMTEQPYVVPDSYEVDVKLPDSSSIVLSVKPKTSVVIKASDIGISKFKDGIYCFSIDPDSELSGGCGISYTKSVGIFPNMECCIDSAFSKLDESLFDKIKEVEHWLNTAKISSDLDKEIQALSEWRVSRDLLKRLNCECNC